MNWKALFRPKFKPYLLNDKYRIVPAFTVGNIDYFMFDNAMEIPAGRTMAALAIYNEMDMKVDKKYLEQHCKAVEKVLSNPKSINIGALAQLNVHLQERLNLMVLPEFIFKLASVIYFDRTENPYGYDYDYAEKKIQRWKESGANLDFFMKTPIAALIPFLKQAGENSKMYLGVAEAVAKIHQQTVSDILSA